MDKELPLSVTLEVRDHCLCLHLQRAARAIARLFDEALRPLELSHGQFSLLISLNRPQAPRLGEVANLLALDRTSLTANLKPLERRGLLCVEADPEDKRGRRLRLTRKGRNLLKRALPVWRETHAALDTLMHDGSGNSLRADLLTLAFAPVPR